MKKQILFIVLFCSVLSYGFTYKDKILYDSPTEDDIIIVNLSLGRMTVLSFSDEVIVVTGGDDELFKVERTQKDVYIKPLFDQGESNLFCWTEKKRYNFHLVIDNVEKVNYVINVDSIVEEQNKGKKLSLQEMLYYCRAYDQLSKMGVLNERILEKIEKNKTYENESQGIKLMVKDIFFHQRPHWLAVSAVVTNTGANTKYLKENLSYLYINNRRIMPSYVVFDLTELSSGSSSAAYFILEESNISKENEFIASLGIGDKEVRFEE